MEKQKKAKNIRIEMMRQLEMKELIKYYRKTTEFLKSFMKS
nr:MAG TPA: hypothetical protein [Caudoviricetes sp.]